MCGIVGAVVRPGVLDAPTVERAVASLHHRGPDGSGVVLAGCTAHWEVWLGHARLAIVDLSPGGRQPMEHRSVGGARGVITFNGEVYNHRALRAEVARHVDLRSSSDTEVLLAGLLRDGPDFLARCNSMLALGLWDDGRRELLLARDRIGKKPLYVYRDEDRLFFASEIKALAALGAPLVLDETSLALFRWLGYVPGERCIWKGMRKMPAASFARLDLSGVRLPDLRPELFWDPLASCSRTFPGTFDDAVDEVLALIDDATKLRLDADVPVGVFLSGGIDSSLVAASVARQHAKTTAYVVQADDPTLDESPVARRTAARLGLDVEVLSLRRDAYERQIAKIPWHFDEPLSDLSQIATMANAEAARRHVTVVLTGDGGDEVFLGYPWVAYPERLWRWRAPIARIPLGRLAARRALDGPLGFFALRVAVRALGLNGATLDAKRDIARALLVAEVPADLYDRFQTARQRETLSRRDQLRIGSRSLLAMARADYPGYSWDAAASRSVPELLGALDLATYLRDDVLVKVDRATMASSLEARSPLLDSRIVEFGLSLPLAYKADHGAFKRVLRAACARRVGSDVAGLPKRGFGIPAPSGLPAGRSFGDRWARATEEGFVGRWRATASAAPQTGVVGRSAMGTAPT